MGLIDLTILGGIAFGNVPKHLRNCCVTRITLASECRVLGILDYALKISSNMAFHRLIHVRHAQKIHALTYGSFDRSLPINATKRKTSITYIQIGFNFVSRASRTA